jgi:TPR repeat protein
MLMQEAAKQGLTQSQNSLAMMYINGVGVEPDYKSAYFWASTSARQGDQEGKQILSHLVSIAQ